MKYEDESDTEYEDTSDEYEDESDFDGFLDTAGMTIDVLYNVKKSLDGTPYSLERLIKMVKDARNQQLQAV